MKIAIDISQSVHGTGVSKYTENLVESLLKIDNKNEYLLFGTSLRGYSKLKKLRQKLSIYHNVNFKFFILPIRIFEILFNWLRIIPINLILGDIDVLHTSDWIEPKVTSSTKKVTTVHDMVPYLFPATLPNRILRNHKRKLKAVKTESKLIITPSSTTKDDVEKLLGIEAEKLKVIPEAASYAFRPQSDEKIKSVLSKYKIKNPYILSVSTREPRKNISTLIDAFEKLSRDFQNINLVLTGKKGWGQAIEIIPNVIETGYVTDEELICLYAGCKVFVYPSLYEGFGLPIIEAMACGAPIIASNNSSIIETAKDAAILVEPRSDVQIKKAIELVLNLETDDYQKMVRASLDRARQYSWAKAAKETLKVYEEAARL